MRFPRPARLRSSLVLSAVLLGLSFPAPTWAGPHLDPFVSLVERPKRREKKREPIRVVPPTPVRKRVPALQLRVEFWVGDEAGEEAAVVSYQGQDYLVHPGWDGDGEDQFDGRFRVLEVEQGAVLVFDEKRKERRRFELD